MLSTRASYSRSRVFRFYAVTSPTGEVSAAHADVMTARRTIRLKASDPDFHSESASDLSARSRNRRARGGERPGVHGHAIVVSIADLHGERSGRGIAVDRWSPRALTRARRAARAHQANDLCGRTLRERSALHVGEPAAVDLLHFVERCAKGREIRGSRPVVDRKSRGPSRWSLV